MNILCIGDIFGSPGRKIIKKILPELKTKLQIDCVIANAENLAHGKGATPETLKEMRLAGIDFFTSGNHIWKNKKILPELEAPQADLIRPANYPPNVPGAGYKIISVHKKKILIINLIGRVFLNHSFDCPFRAAQTILAAQRGKFDLAIIDFHAEATSEKIALKHFLDGQVALLFGTHTHVPTADAQITAKGTAYISDVGMVGPVDSIIGLKKEPILENFLLQMPAHHIVADGEEGEFNAILVEINHKKNRPISIKQIILKEKL